MCLEGVGEVVKVDLGGHDGALAGDEAPVDDAADGEHGKAAVLELGELVACEGGGVLAEAKRVKAEVAGLAARGEHGVARHLEVVGEVLDHAAEDEDLPQAASGDLEEGLGGNGVGGGGEGELHELLDNAAEGGEHGNAAVLELSLAEPVKRVLGGEAKGVEANVANHGAVEGSRAGEEGHRGRVLLHLHACHDNHENTRTLESRTQPRHASRGWSGLEVSPGPSTDTGNLRQQRERPLIR